MSEQRWTCANDRHEFLLGGPGFTPCPACTPVVAPGPIDWPARFRTAAALLDGSDWDEEEWASAMLCRLAAGIEREYIRPEMVDAIGRALLGQDEP